MRRSRIGATAAVVAATVIAACSEQGGGEGPSPDASHGEDGQAEQAFDSDRAGPAVPVEGAVQGGTVTVLSNVELPTMDPTEAYYLDTTSILSGLVTRSLTQYAYDPKQGAMVLVPDIATDLGTANEDFTEWSFTIRDGVKFENGAEVTAEDVAYGIKRSLDRRTFPDGPSYSNDYFLDGDTYGGVHTSGTNYSGIEVEGNTLTITMERPFPDMPYWGAFPAMGPIPERGGDPATYALHPLATGPYKFADYTPGKSLTLVRNEHWDPETDPGRHDYPERFEFRFRVPSKQIDAVILGNTQPGQTTLTYDNVLPTDYRQAQSLNRLTLGSTNCTIMERPDYGDITDIRVRQAIGYAYPYDELAKLDGAIPGVTILRGSSILPPEFPEREEYHVLEGRPGVTDPDKARTLLKQAGYKTGELELSFPYPNDQFSPAEIRKLFVESFEAAGFTATPVGVPDSEMFRVNSDPTAPINLRSSGWCSDWPSGSSWFPPLFHSKGTGNFSMFAEPEIDAEIDRIGALPFEEQPAAWAALDKTIMTDYYPAVIVGYLAAAMLHGSKIGGMNIDAIYGMPTWKDLYVDR